MAFPSGLMLSIGTGTTSPTGLLSITRPSAFPVYLLGDTGPVIVGVAACGPVPPSLDRALTPCNGDASRLSIGVAVRWISATASFMCRLAFMVFTASSFFLWLSARKSPRFITTSSVFCSEVTESSIFSWIDRRLALDVEMICAFDSSSCALVESVESTLAADPRRVV